jgi:hypothetical protein
MRIRTSKTTWLGGGNYTLDCSIGSMHYQDAKSNWQPIDIKIISDGKGGWSVSGVQYYVEVSNDGTRKIYPDTNDRTKYIQFGSNQIISNLNKTKNGNDTLTMSSEWGCANMVFETDAVKFKVDFNENPSFNSISLPVTTVGYNFSEILISKNGMGVPNPRMTDADGKEKELNWIYDGSTVSLNLDFSEMVFPITFATTTINFQVQASANDCHVGYDGEYECEWFIETDDDYQWAGYGADWNYNMGGAMRFIPVNIPRGSNIENAYITLYSHNNSITIVNTYLSGQASNNSEAFSTLADYNNRPKTALIAWDNIPAWENRVYYNSPDISSIIQTIVNRPGWNAGNALVIFWDDHDGRSTPYECRYRAGRSYDGSTTYAPKLHIEYTIPNLPIDYLYEENLQFNYTYYHSFYLIQGQTYTFETRKDNPNSSDPVMYLFNRDDSINKGSWSDDDSGDGYQSKIICTPQYTGYYI